MGGREAKVSGVQAPSLSISSLVTKNAVIVGSFYL